jgi:hypothetical protein
MRTCAEIRAIVEESPYWEGYTGDGASIPWQYLPPPYNLYLLAYKGYLDTRWPEAFRLHDFLYSLASEGLGVERKEADDCLFIDMADSPLDSQIVYQAVRIWGGPYFHQTWEPWHQDNMGATIRSDSMPTQKISMLIQEATNRSGGANPAVTRLSGWSESWLTFGVASPEAALDQMVTVVDGYPAILPARAALLGRGASIVGIRAHQVDPKGPSIIRRVSYVGGSWEVDVPGMALLCQGKPAAAFRPTLFRLAGLPDSQVVQGEFVPSGGYGGAVNEFFASLGNYGSYTTDPASVIGFPLQGVSGVGVATTNLATPYTVGQYVMIKTRGALGITQSGWFRVEAVGGGGTILTLLGWPYGTCVGGKVYVPTTTGQTFRTGLKQVLRVVHRKTGRPFVQYVGRRSRRR